MRVLFIGLGSIGTRHLKNLHTLAAARGLSLQVEALRSSARALPAETAALLDAQQTDAAMLGEYDLVFLTNPTQLHAEGLRALRGKVGCWFIEKPIFEAPIYSLEAVGLGQGQKAYVAAPMRWCAVYQALRARLADCQPHSVRILCSSYLPEWRPGVDYRQVYSARKALGGGVTLDLIHEWDYLVDLFGFPLETHGFKGHYSALEMDADDLSVAIARYPRLLAELHLDYTGRGYRRSAEFITDDGILTADFGAGRLSFTDGKSLQTQDFAEPVNERYLREMNYFLDYVQGEETESLNSPELALQVLRLALG